MTAPLSGHAKKVGQNRGALDVCAFEKHHADPARNLRFRRSAAKRESIRIRAYQVTSILGVAIGVRRLKYRISDLEDPRFRLVLPLPAGARPQADKLELINPTIYFYYLKNII